MANERMHHSDENLLRRYGSVRLATAQKKTAKDVHAQYLDGLQYVRGTYLMEMYAVDQSLKQNVPILSLFKGMFTAPVRLFMSHSPMFNQRLMLHVQSLLKEPERFAGAVVPFLVENQSLILQFAYGLFPSFYGYFIGAEFCEVAIEFLAAVFKQKQSEKISEALIASFFCSCHGFYDCLWQNMASGLMEMTPNSYNFFKIFNVVEAALKGSLPFLSTYHIQVFALFCAAFPKHCSRFFVETILVKQFLRVASSSVCFTSESQNKMLMTFMDELLRPVRMVHNEGLLNTVITYKGSLDFNPSMNLKIWMKGIPVTVSERDIQLLVDILSSKFSKPRFPQDHNERFNDSFSPCVMEVFVPCNRAPVDTVIRDMFGIIPPPVEVEDDENEEFNRLWRQMWKLAVTSGENPAEFLVKKASTFQGPFGEFFKRHVLSVFGENFMSIQDTILLAENLDQFNRYNLFIVSHNVSLYHGFFYEFFKATLAKTPSLSKTFKTVSNVVELPMIGFEISCIVLDCAAFPVSKQMKKAQNRYMKLVDKWMEKEWPKYQKTCSFKSRIKYILDAVTVFNQIEAFGLGKILKIVIHFVFQLKDILGDNWDMASDWIVIFHYALFAAQCPHILPIFLTFHHFVFSITSIVAKWGEKICDAWTMFATGMWYLMKSDEKFCSFCSDWSQCKTLFNLPK